MGSLDRRVRRMSAAATCTDRASHGLPGERVLPLTAGVSVSWPMMVPFGSMSRRSLLAACGSNWREHDLGAVGGEDLGRTQTSRTYPSACEGSTPSDPNHQMVGTLSTY